MQLAHDQAVKIGARPKPNQDSLDQYARCIEGDPARFGEGAAPRAASAAGGPIPAGAAVERAHGEDRAEPDVRPRGAVRSPGHQPHSARVRPASRQVDRRTLTPDAAVGFVAWSASGSTVGAGVMQDTAQRGYDRLRIVDVLLGTGIRIGEVLSLAWDDIHDLDSDHPTAYIGWHLDKAARRVEGRKSGDAHTR